MALWTELEVSRKIVKDLELAVGQHLRFNRNFSAFDDYIFDLRLEYTINKNFAFGANGRYERNGHYDDTTEDDYRYDLFFKFDTKVSEHIRFFYRLKYQKKFYDSAVFNKFLNHHETAYRNRIKFDYRGFDKQQPYISAEIFRLIKKLRDPRFDKYRVFIGSGIPVSKHNLDVAAGYERDLNSRYPLNLYIFKLQWQFKL